jgi:hypothetical protein
MPRSFNSPSGADGERRPVERLSMIYSADFVEDDGFSQIRARREGAFQESPEPLPRPKPNSLEVKVWAVVFAVIILASAILIILALSDEPSHPQPAGKVSQLGFTR